MPHIEKLLDRQIWTQVVDQVVDQISALTRAQINNQVCNRSWASVWNRFGIPIRDQVGQVFAQAREDIDVD